MTVSTPRPAAAAPIAGVVARRRDEFVDVLLTLLRHASVNPAYDAGGGERGAQEGLAAILVGWGADVELWEPGADELAPFAAEEPAARKSLQGRPNLLAELRGAGGGRTLILNGHVDVVAAGEPEWEGDPFSPRLDDGCVHARGAADAKGSLAAMSCALAVAAELGIDGTVLLESVVDEEGGGAGTLACIGRGIGADAAIVGEPTDLALCPATRGSRRLHVRVAGRSAHPGEAFRGVNAAEKAFVLVDALVRCAASLDRTRPHPLWSAFPQQHVFNLNFVQAGSRGHGAVPDACELELAAGGTAAETIDELQAAVEEAIADAVARDDWLRGHPPALEWGENVLHPSVTPVDCDFVRACARAAETVSGRAPRVHALSAVTDMRHLVRYGGIPTLNFGPGRMEHAHGPNEHVRVDDYLAAISILASIILEWCRGDGAAPPSA